MGSLVNDRFDRPICRLKGKGKINEPNLIKGDTPPSPFSKAGGEKRKRRPRKEKDFGTKGRKKKKKVEGANTSFDFVELPGGRQNGVGG